MNWIFIIVWRRFCIQSNDRANSSVSISLIRWNGLTDFIFFALSWVVRCKWFCTLASNRFTIYSQNTKLWNYFRFDDTNKHRRQFLLIDKINNKNLSIVCSIDEYLCVVCLLSRVAHSIIATHMCGHDVHSNSISIYIIFTLNPKENSRDDVKMFPCVVRVMR